MAKIVNPQITPGLTVTKRELIEVAEINPDHRRDVDSCATMFSTYLIEKFLGKPWMKAYMLSRIRLSSYFEWHEGEVEDRVNFNVKAYWLASMLHNLQHVHGFQHCLSKLQGKQVEATIFELQTARIIRTADISFEFVEPSDQRRYDLEILLRDGTRACIESKCKVPQTDVSEDTLYESLDIARDQLPRTGCNFIFLSLSKKFLDEESHALVRRAVDKLYRGSSRVSSVKTVFSQFQVDEAQQSYSGSVWVDETFNPRQQENFQDSWKLFSSESHDGSLNNWTTVHELATEAVRFFAP